MNGLVDELTDDLRARVKNELEPGERLLWAAQSDLIEPRGLGFLLCQAARSQSFFSGWGFSWSSRRESNCRPSMIT